MYEGVLVRFRELRDADLKLAQKFINDPEVSRNLSPRTPFLATLKDEKAFLDGISFMKDTYNFAIEAKDSNKYIGGCGINEIDWKNSVATVGIMIGDKDYWSKGYGTDAMKLLVKFIFEQMNVNKIKLNVYSFNERARKCYLRTGFTQEGILREELFRDGKYHDIILMGILKSEYFGI
ncbi:MAG: GNAT family protein [Acidaminobacteraceae bacterium]